MSDLSDVEDVLVNQIQEILYPNGVNQPSAVSSVPNIKIYAGWPFPANLQPEIKNNIVHVSIYPLTANKNTTRFHRVWMERSRNLATVFATAGDTTVTITGNVYSNPLQTVMVIVNKIGYAYTVVSGDSPNSIAANLAALIPGSSALANVLTIPSAFSLEAKVNVQGDVSLEQKRQEQQMMVTIWSALPSTRRDVAIPIDIGLGSLDRLSMPDGFYARIVHTSTREHDESYEKTTIYRRDLIYQIEYATTVADKAYEITDSIENTEIVNSIN